VLGFLHIYCTVTRSVAVTKQLRWCTCCVDIRKYNSNFNMGKCFAECFHWHVYL